MPAFRPPPDVDAQIQQSWENFDKLGVETVRRKLASPQWPESVKEIARRWIEHYESSSAAASADAVIEEARAANALARSANELASDANAVARDANTTAREAADAAKTNNKIAIAALTAAIISIIISILSIFLRHGGH